MDDQVNPSLASIISTITLDFLALSEYLQKFPITCDKSTLEDCRNFLLLLLELLAEVEDKSKCFGIEVFLNDLKKLYQGPIQNIKSKSKDFTSELTLSDYPAVVTLRKEFKALTYVRKSIDSGVVTNYSKFVDKISSDSIDHLIPDLESYLNVGSALKDDQITQLFIAEIANIYLENYCVSPFISIVGPSCMGKTQTAFTLAHSIDVIYVNLSATLNTVLSNQNIYELFRGLAKIFLSCIKEDTDYLESAEILGHAEDIQNLTWPFKTLGLFYVLFQMRELKKHSSIKDWYLDLINIDSIMIPFLTVKDFKLKFKGTFFN